MTPNSLRDLMGAAGWSTFKLAELLGINEGTVRDWLKGRRGVPDALVAWLVKVDEFYAMHPVPFAQE